jgi:hypothetical protein
MAMINSLPTLSLLNSSTHAVHIHPRPQPSSSRRTQPRRHVWHTGGPPTIAICPRWVLAPQSFPSLAALATDEYSAVVVTPTLFVGRDQVDICDCPHLT